jgi:hypothetical protein
MLKWKNSIVSSNVTTKAVQDIGIDSGDVESVRYGEKNDAATRPLYNNHRMYIPV